MNWPLLDRNITYQGTALKDHIDTVEAVLERERIAQEAKEKKNRKILGKRTPLTKEEEIQELPALLPDELGEFHSEELPDIYKFYPITFPNGKRYIVDITKEKIDPREKGEYWLPDTREFYSILRTLYMYREQPEHQQTINKFLYPVKKDLGGFNSLLFDTSIEHHSLGRDKIIHHPIDSPSQHKVNVRGPWSYLDESHRSIADALFGTDNTAEVNQVFYWLGEKPLFLYRVEERSNVIVPRLLLQHSQFQEEGRFTLVMTATGNLDHRCTGFRFQPYLENDSREGS
ncbi:hypothetical protein ACFL0V_03925 [Nanoarchaeota archaeon]